MTNAELLAKIKAEIERLMCPEIQYSMDQLLSFLDTLESEKPMNQEGLEEAVVDYFEGYWPGMETAEQCNTDLHFTPPAIMRLVRHFAQWGAEHTPLLEDTVLFNKGVEEGKRLMMDEAVEGKVSAVILHENGDEVHYAVTYPEGERPHSITDKVRIIILPKED